MRKEISVALFKTFEQCKKTVYADVSLPDGPASDSEYYKQEVESTVRQRVRVLRTRIPHLDYAEACERKFRVDLLVDALVLLFLIILAVVLPWHFKAITLVPIVFVIIEIWLSNHRNRVLLTAKGRADCPNFDLDKEVETDIQLELKSKG